MSNLMNRMADRMLTRFAPRADADAACTVFTTFYCYCSGGLAYRRICYDCGGGVYYCTACQVTGTC